MCYAGVTGDDVLAEQVWVRLFADTQPGGEQRNADFRAVAHSMAEDAPVIRPTPGLFLFMEIMSFLAGM